MTSTPLPEQGGFNEQLSEILHNIRDDIIAEQNGWQGTPYDGAEAIRSLIAEEIIGNTVTSVIKDIREQFALVFNVSERAITEKDVEQILNLVESEYLDE